MKIAVCEDNAAELDAICGYIEKYCARNCYLKDIHRFSGGEELLAAFAPGEYQIIFLDIYMGGLSGVETARKIRESDPNCTLIFITVSGEHALEAYSVKAIAYVKKPLNAKNVAEALDMCKETLQKNARVIRVPVGYGNIVEIPLPAIRYVEVYNKEAVFHLSDKTISVRIPLDEIEKTLNGDPFLRCHRSYIVNINYLDDVREQDILLKGGQLAPLAKNKRAEIKLSLARFIAQGAWEKDA